MHMSLGLLVIARTVQLLTEQVAQHSTDSMDRKLISISNELQALSWLLSCLNSSYNGNSNEITDRIQVSIFF